MHEILCPRCRGCRLRLTFSHKMANYHLEASQLIRLRCPAGCSFKFKYRHHNTVQPSLLYSHLISLNNKFDLGASCRRIIASEFNKKVCKLLDHLKSNYDTSYILKMANEEDYRADMILWLVTGLRTMNLAYNSIIRKVLINKVSWDVIQSCIAPMLGLDMTESEMEKIAVARVRYWYKCNSSKCDIGCGTIGRTRGTHIRFGQKFYL